MKIIANVLIVILFLLAVSSGIAKIMLTPRDVQFFGEFGFTNPVLIGFGVLQVVGGLLFAIPRYRVIGGLVIAVTFLVSAVLLVVAGDVSIAAVTLLFIVLLGMVIQQSRSSKSERGDASGT